MLSLEELIKKPSNSCLPDVVPLFCRFLAQTGLVPVETQMQELNLAPTTDKSN